MTTKGTNFLYFIDWPDQPPVEIDLIALDIPAVEIIEIAEKPIVTIQNEDIILALPVGGDDND